MTIQEVANHLHCPYSRVQYSFKKNNIKTRPRLRMTALSMDQRLAILEKYHDKVNYNALAKEYNVHNATIRKSLQFFDVQLRKGYTKYQCDTQFFHEINTEEKAYWLGFIFADGCVGNGVFTLGLALRDINHLEKLQKCINSNHKIEFYQHKSPSSDTLCHVATLRICNTEFIKGLLKNGVHPRKTYDIMYPHLEDEELERHFIRGIFDGDGSFGITDRASWFKIAGLKNFLESIQLHLMAKVSVNKTVFDIRKVICELRYGGSVQVFRLADYIYHNSNIYLDRKYEKYLEIKENIWNQYGELHYNSPSIYIERKRNIFKIKEV